MMISIGEEVMYDKIGGSISNVRRLLYVLLQFSKLFDFDFDFLILGV